MAQINKKNPIPLSENQFGQISEPKFRMQQQQHANRPDSTYDVYDNYLSKDAKRQSGIGAIGLGLMNGDFDDSDDEDEPSSATTKPSIGNTKPLQLSTPTSPTRSESQYPATRNGTGPIPIAAPKPGYAAPVAALNLARPPPSVSPQVRHPLQMSQAGGATPLSIRPPPLSTPSPFMIPSMPSTPHPLQPPMSPITPALAKPPKAAEGRDVKFVAGQQPILRGNSEETLLPKRGEHGDDFWRRFSIVAKVEDKKRYQQSSWLHKTQSSYSRMSRWVWIVGLFLLVIIGGAVGIGFYLNHEDSSESVPDAIGGSADEGSAPPPEAATPQATLSSSLHVSPTNTVAKRDTDAFATLIPILQVQPFSHHEILQKHRHRANWNS